MPLPTSTGAGLDSPDQTGHTNIMPSTPSLTDRVHPIVLAVLAAFLLCGMDAVAKHLIASNHPIMVSFGRYVMGIGFAYLVWRHAGRPALTADIWRAHALRGLAVACSGFSFFWALGVLPFVEVFTIAFLAPLMVPFLARWLLGEAVRVRSVLAALGGFVGVLVAVWAPSPDMAGSRHLMGVAAAFVSALSYALSVVLMRQRAAKDGAAVLGLTGTVIPALVLGAPALWLAPVPAPADWPWFAAMGLLATAGIFALSKAYARAQAQVLAPIDYTALIWAAVIGFAVFGEQPRAQVWAGAAIIIAACVWSSRPAPATVQQI